MALHAELSLPPPAPAKPVSEHSAGRGSPADSSPGWEQQGDHGVAQALAEGAEELAVLYVIASVQAQSLLPSLLFSLNGIKIPSQLENRGVKIHGLYVSRRCKHRHPKSFFSQTIKNLTELS